MRSHQIEEIAKGFRFRGKRLSPKVEETHISWVLLTPQYAFKIKKPVKLSFLDFSTLTLRKKSCEKEVSLNGRLSNIYLGVVPIRFDTGSWHFGDHPGATVDYAVVMKRLRSSKRMDLLLSKDQVTVARIKTLATFIGDFHGRARIISTPFDGPLTSKLFNDVLTIRDFAAETIGVAEGRIIAAAVTWSDAFLKKHAKRFRQRVSSGYKRDLHGDLHCSNIFLYREPVIFDCIEFDDSFRHVDLLDEIAFLCMDIESMHRQDLAQILLNVYSSVIPLLETSEDHEIFTYYKCYRANVRAKVHAIAALHEDDTANRNQHVTKMAGYLRLIEGYIGLASERSRESINKADSISS